jgi:hypothetical protein
MVAVGNLNREAEQGEQTLGIGIHRHMLDIRTGLGDGSRNLGQHATHS